MTATTDGPLSPGEAVAIPSLIDREAVSAVVQALDRAIQEPRSEQPLRLDFSSLNGSFLNGHSSRVGAQWGAVLSNLLSSRYRDVPLRVELPESDPAQLQMARAGLYFALARHKHLDWQSLDETRRRALREWQANWEPADVQQPLFHFDRIVDGEEVPPALANALVAFLNPDLAPREDTPGDQDAVLYPWLLDLVPKTRTRQEWRLELFQGVSRIIFELLDNVRDHAGLGYDDQCSVTCFTTGRGADARLYLSIADTGRGMIATLPETLSEKSYEDRVAAAFDGTMPLRERLRGRGLHQVLTTIDHAGSNARLFAATGPADGATVVVDYRGRSNDLRRVLLHDIGVVGTVVVLCLPLRPPIGVEDDDEPDESGVSN